MLNEIMVDEDCSILLIKRRSGIILKCMVDTGDIPRIAAFNHKWSAFWSETAKTWYVYCRHKREITLLHRWLLSTPDVLHVDHQDHDGLNNRRRNIRSVTRSVNQLNNRKPSNNTSGYRGVVWDAARGLWQARVKVLGRNILIGRFSDSEKANEAITSYRKDELGCLA